MSTQSRVLARTGAVVFALLLVNSGVAAVVGATQIAPQPLDFAPRDASNAAGAAAVGTDGASPVAVARSSTIPAGDSSAIGAGDSPTPDPRRSATVSTADAAAAAIADSETTPSARAATPPPAVGLSIDRDDRHLTFVPNAGQHGEDVQFLARGSGRTAYFGARTVTFVDRDDAGNASAIRLGFDGARADPVVEGTERADGVVNVYGDAAHTGLETYRGVAYRDLYDGVDLVYGGSNGVLKSEFVVAPGADPTAVRMNYSEPVAVAADGSLVVGEGDDPLIEEPPFAYQRVDGERVEVEVRFVRLDETVAGFRLGEYDPDRPLVVDPTISYLVPAYSTFLGGTDDDHVTDIAVDGAGNAYVTGWTWSPDFPVTDDLYGQSHLSKDAFLAKYDRYGNMTYATYLAGNGTDEAFAVAVDGAGNAYVGGETGSPNFPVRSAFQPELVEGLSVSTDAFLSKLDDRGFLVYSTYVGGGADQTFGGDAITGLAAGSGGEVFVVGETNSDDFPRTAPGWANAGESDAFIGRFDAGGTPAYLRAFGGTDEDFGLGIAVDAADRAYVTGYTLSDDLPTSPGALQTAPSGPSTQRGPNWDAFVAGFDDTGARTYSTYLGGPTLETGRSIAVDGDGAVYVAGDSPGLSLPIVNGELPGGADDAFLWKLDFSGNASAPVVAYSTYLGGPGVDVGRDVAVDDAGAAYLVGSTENASHYDYDPRFPTTNAFQPAFAGGSYEGAYGDTARLGDAFVAKIDTERTSDSLLVSSYLGGSQGELATGVGVDDEGNVYVAGTTYSADFPTRTLSEDADQAFGGGTFEFLGEDGFVTRLSPSVCRTDPDGNGNPDNDGDGLCDEWELNGVDVDDDGVVDLPIHRAPYGADPDRKDVFVEIDYMDCTVGKSADACDPANAHPTYAGNFETHTHRLDKPMYERSLRAIERAFADAPVSNPDGTSGITLHLMVDEAVPEYSPMFFSDTALPDKNATAANNMAPAGKNFSDVKHGTEADACDGYFGTAAERSGAGCEATLEARGMIFRYALVGHDQASDLEAVGVAELPGDDMFITMDEGDFAHAHNASKLWGTSASDEWSDEFAATFMHELGHTLGLRHGGADHTNYKPNYLSVMNYALDSNAAAYGNAIAFDRLDNTSFVMMNLSSSAAYGPRLFTVNESNRTIVVRETVNGSTKLTRVSFDRLNASVSMGADLYRTDLNETTVVPYVRLDRPLDYSRAARPTIDERSLDETVGVGGPEPGWNWSIFHIDYSSFAVPVGAAADWNRDGNVTDGVVENINHGGEFEAEPNQTLHGFDDWNNVVYDFRHAEGYGKRSPRADLPYELPTGEDYRRSVFPSEDVDGDGVPNEADSCLVEPNPAQSDDDDDGVGDACEDAMTAGASVAVAVPGQPIAFAAAGDADAFAWSFGDGATAAGTAVSHAYETTGTYEIAVIGSVSDVAAVDRDSVTVRVVESSPEISIDAVPETTVNNAGAPIEISIVAADADGGLASLALLRPDGTVADEETCLGTTCLVTLTGSVDSPTWNGSTSEYDAASLRVLVFDADGHAAVAEVTTPVFAAGDATGDGLVNVFDAATIGRAWGADAGDPRYDDAADLDNDGRVDAADRAALADNWGAAADS